MDKRKLDGAVDKSLVDLQVHKSVVIVYVTGPAKTEHICTQILHHFSNFNLTLPCTY